MLRRSISGKMNGQNLGHKLFGICIQLAASLIEIEVGRN
jgi:hypothetical protein